MCRLNPGSPSEQPLVSSRRYGRPGFNYLWEIKGQEMAVMAPEEISVEKGANSK